ncbi:MAG TPA: hypothetical protein VJH06_02040 [Candidatus Paceibacterota bacterium]
MAFKHIKVIAKEGVCFVGIGSLEEDVVRVVGKTLIREEIVVSRVLVFTGCSEKPATGFSAEEAEMIRLLLDEPIEQFPTELTEDDVQKIRLLLGEQIESVEGIE